MPQTSPARFVYRALCTCLAPTSIQGFGPVYAHFSRKGTEHCFEFLEGTFRVCGYLPRNSRGC